MSKNFENAGAVYIHTGALDNKGKNKIGKRDIYTNASNSGVKNSAITLIALIITIIVLLILIGVTLNMIMGENGIMRKAETASEETNKQNATEKLSLKITNIQINTYTTKQKMPTLQELANELDKDNEIEYVKKKKVEVGSLADVNIGDATSILTKLKDYKYEFEINNKFQLASIDGEKISDSNYNSQVINNIEISAGDIGGENAKINVNVNFKDSYTESDIVAYFIVANNEVKGMYTTKPSNIENLDVATKYNVYLMIVDKYAGISRSLPIEIETIDMKSTILEYPIITSSGIKNVMNIYNDGKTEYAFKNDKECTAKDVVGKNAYDGDEKTLFPGGDAKSTYINIDESAWGKKLFIKYDTGYKWLVFYNSSGGTLSSTDTRENNVTLTIPNNAQRLLMYFNEGGGIYEMYVQD